MIYIIYYIYYILYIYIYIYWYNGTLIYMFNNKNVFLKPWYYELVIKKNRNKQNERNWVFPLKFIFLLSQNTFHLNSLMPFSKLELLLTHVWYLQKRKQPLKESFIRLYKRIIFIGQMLWFLRIQKRVSKFMCLSISH